MNIQEEIHEAMRDIQDKISKNQEIGEEGILQLLLTALVEEEAS